MAYSSTTETGTTYQWTLNCSQENICDSVLLLEELLWTIDGVQSIEEIYRKDTDDVLDYALDGVNRLEHLEALQVVANSPDIQAPLEDLLKSQPSFSCWRLSDAKPITLEDWAESWKQHWQPTRIHEHLLICPSWITYQPENTNETVITLDPGAAFGTGTHETTCLMLQGLNALSNEIDFSTVSVLDVGTGSGILAVYAAQLGCRSVIGIDNDPNSVPAAMENANRNNVSSVCTFSATPLEDLCHTKHDIILANIIAPVILALLPEMVLRLADKGRLILSGLIEKNLPDVIEALKAHGLDDTKTRQQGDWFAIDIRKSV